MDYLGEKDKETLPGPVSYENRGGKKTNSAIFIGIEKRPDVTRLRTAPGPGAYNTHGDREKGVSFSMGAKVYEKPPAKIPGPGEYN